MVRSLPENTVDAWTSIELARARSPWIWLPTTNQGSTIQGSHPGDVSAVLGGRLVIVENKGIEAEATVEFGGKWRGQRDYLRKVEEIGLSAVSDPPPLGWVFFGLPLRSGAVFGSDWQGFPAWHHMSCPHALDVAGIGGSAAVSTLRSLPQHVGVHGRTPRPTTSLVYALSDLRLARLALACDLGIAGLPLPGPYDESYSLLRGLVERARGAFAEASSEIDDTAAPPFFNGDGLLELLAELAALAGAWTGHAVLTVLPHDDNPPPEND